MTLVNAETGELITLPTREHAARWAERTRLDLEAAADRGEAGLSKIRTAMAERHDEALGYRSLGDYVSTEFADALGNVCRVFGVEFRREVVRELTDAGMSTRAIAPVVGAAFKTVARDIEAGVSLDTPEPAASDVETYDRAAGVTDVSPSPETPAPEPLGEGGDGAGQTSSDRLEPKAAPAEDTDSAPESDDATAASEGRDTPEPPAPRPVTGRDGKTYSRKPKAKPRSPLPDSFFRATYDALRKIEALHRLVHDDRWPQNAEQVAARNRHDLSRMNDLLQQVIRSLPEKEATT